MSKERIHVMLWFKCKDQSGRGTTWSSEVRTDCTLPNVVGFTLAWDRLAWTTCLNLQFYEACLDLCQSGLILIFNIASNFFGHSPNNISNLIKVPLSEDRSLHTGGIIRIVLLPCASYTWSLSLCNNEGRINVLSIFNGVFGTLILFFGMIIFVVLTL